MTMAADGAGGWYLGGSFKSVAGVPRINLAHVRADGTLDAWNPGANARVNRLLVSGSTVYASGQFTSVAGQPRFHLAALDAGSGLAIGWNPSPNGDVLEIMKSGSTLYVGGTFSSVGGQARSCIAALDATTGMATAWNPGGNYDVHTIVVDGARVYVAGGFTNIGGQSRNGLAALDVNSGLATSWAPEGSNWNVLAIAVDGSTVYVGGGFNSIGGATRRNIAALDANTALATGWNPGVDSMYQATHSPNFDLVNAIVVGGGSRVYAAGSFGNIGYQNRSNIAALDATTGLATSWNPGTNGTVCVLAVAGDTVYAGGYFRSVGGRTPGRVAAFDLTTGAALDWNPGIYSPSVASLAKNGSTVDVGCELWSYGGPLHGPLRGIEDATGNVTAWNPAADNSVLALAVSDSLVFAGGAFTNVGGQTHRYFAAIDAASGLTTPWSPDANGRVRALAWSGSTLIAGGDFSQLGGQPRARIAALDASTGATTAWSPGADGVVTAISVNGSTVYVGGGFSTIGGQLRVGIAAIDGTTGLATSWNPGAAGTQLGVQAIAVTGSQVYAGGTFTTMGGQPRQYFAALDATTGLATTWSPGADGPVYSLTASGGAVLVGGAIQYLGGRAVRGLARILPTPTALPMVSVLSPDGGEVVIRNATHPVTWSASAVAPGVESVDLYLSRSGPSGPWELIAAGAPNTGQYGWTVSGSTSPGDCYLRVDARDYAGGLSSDVSGAGFAIVDGALAVSPPGGIMAFALSRIAPNPVRSTAQFEYVLPRQGRVRLTLVDLQGREVRVLINVERDMGRHVASLDMRGLRSGLYFVRLQAGNSERSQRFVVVN